MVVCTHRPSRPSPQICRPGKWNPRPGYRETRTLALQLDEPVKSQAFKVFAQGTQVYLA